MPPPRSNQPARVCAPLTRIDAPAAEFSLLASLIPVTAEEATDEGTTRQKARRSASRAPPASATLAARAARARPPRPLPRRPRPHRLPVRRAQVDPLEWCRHLPDHGVAANILPVETSDENKVMWQHVVPEPIKKAFSLLHRNGKLGWGDILEDGNFIFEISFTVRRRRRAAPRCPPL